MKIYLCLLLLIIPLFMFAQDVKPTDIILGTWWTAGKESTVEIYKIGNEFQGKITWLKIPLDEKGLEKTDPENPKAELRGRKRLGMVILHNLVAKNNNEWVHGKIYDPKNGKTYSCIITMKDNNTLFLHGYLGVKFAGRTSTWLRVK